MSEVDVRLDLVLQGVLEGWITESESEEFIDRIDRLYGSEDAEPSDDPSDPRGE